jgi:hypothetical protein
MDKDTIVSKIIQENNQLATDLEHFQEMKSQYDDAMKEARLARQRLKN